MRFFQGIARFPTDGKGQCDLAVNSALTRAKPQAKEALFPWRVLFLPLPMGTFVRVWRNGRREGLKHPFRKECRFESDHPHQIFLLFSQRGPQIKWQPYCDVERKRNPKRQCQINTGLGLWQCHPHRGGHRDVRG